MKSPNTPTSGKAGLDISALRRRVGLPADGDPSGSNNHARILRRWAVAHRPFGPTRTTLLQAIASRMSAFAGPCTAGYETLATDTGLSSSAVYEHVGAAVPAGQLYRGTAENRRSPSLTVTVDPTDEERSDLYGVWTGGGMEEPEEQRTWLDTYRISGLPHGQLRLLWEVHLRRADLPTSAIGTALSIALNWNGSGQPYRRLTTATLAAWSGYSAETVSDRIRDLEAAGWLWVQRHRGANGGLEPWLRIPADAMNAIQWWD